MPLVCGADILRINLQSHASERRAAARRTSMHPDRSVVFLPNGLGIQVSTGCLGAHYWRQRLDSVQRLRRGLETLEVLSRAAPLALQEVCANMPTCSTQMPRIISHHASVSADACQHPEGASGATA